VITRSQLIVRGALATGGLYGAGAVAPFVERALAQGARGDLAIFDFALTLEATEAAFYKQLLKLKGYDADVKKALTEIAGHEDEHVKQLKDTLEGLGAAASPKVVAVSLAKPTSQQEVLRRAIGVEEFGIAAYNGAAPLLQSPDLLVAAGAIVQVEGRHAGALRELAGQDPAPAAFDKALSPDEAQKRFEKGL
jgi:rubrerythrin